MKRDSELHKGHRQRMKNKFCVNGLDGFLPHEIIELMLYYAIPRKDVNELSHQLIEKFGSVSGVIEADKMDLMSVDGIGENAAVMFGLFREVARKCMLEKTPIPPTYTTIKDIGEYFTRFFYGMKTEQIYAMIFDENKVLIDTYKVATGSERYVKVDYNVVASKALKRGARSIVIAHNHPVGSLAPSREDRESAMQLKSIFDLLQIEFIDFLTISGKYYVTMFNKYDHRLVDAEESVDTCDAVFRYCADDIFFGTPKPSADGKNEKKHTKM